MADPELEGHSFIAVYDGHGGQFSAIYCGQHMLDFLKKTAAFQDYKK
jgi:serine/threonine protein phosphatase PrpC